MTDCGTERTLKPGAGTFAFEERVGVQYSPINACLCFTAELAIGFATLPIAGSAIGIEDKSRITLYFAVRGTNAREKAMPVRRCFESVVANGIAAGLVGGEALSIDASLINVDCEASRPCRATSASCWRRLDTHKWGAQVKEPSIGTGKLTTERCTRD